MGLQKLREFIASRGLDGFLVTNPENRRYLSGFTGSAGVLLITPDSAYIATDFRYYEQVARECPSFVLVKVEKQFADVLPKMLDEAKVKVLGFESPYLTVEEYRKWRRLTRKVKWVPCEDIVGKIRSVKSPQEIQTIRRAVSLADEAFHHICQVLRPGMSEKEAAWEIEHFMRTHGADKVAFDLIVASGPNGALPHARASDRIIKEGEPVVIDIGCVVDGYCSDLTRTVVLGRADERFREVYSVVLKAQDKAERAIKAGMRARRADSIARRVIEKAGYGPHFGHGLGHGIGLNVHEKPTVGKASGDILQSGNVITVEPGIYLPGWGGVRIEDVVLVREDGVEILTRSPKGLEFAVL
ncbi:MAG: Xaa-Pro peptidase family protein [Anaerolineae bacterium]|nr:Xaa-Pro peptidase family protein [Anaerolineae bacterium]MDW8102816.1 Xaa-Pro peptidase family protein [Anaerolineae bacterium]